VLICTLVVSHLIGITIYSLDRGAAVTSTEAHDFADRVVGMVTLLDHLPREWHQDIVRESDGRTFHVTLNATPDTVAREDVGSLSEEVARYLRSQLPEWAPDRILVGLSETPFVPRGTPSQERSAQSAASPNGTAGSEQPRTFLHISIWLGDEGWLNFVGEMPAAQTFWPLQASAYMLTILVGVGAVAVWLVFRVTAPLTAFAQAADRLGRDIRAEPLRETGSREVAQASRAFNAMQQRIRRLVENRTQILAALSHDLKTPMTLLRLRLEMMEDGSEKAKALQTLDEMESMIVSVLEFTKVTLLNEPWRSVDLPALLASICEDMADAGADIEFQSTGKISYSCRRVGLKRALTNLIDNAVEHGERARVRLRRQDAMIVVEIEDDGPGVPEDQQDAIFMPFYRIDQSRSEGTGGTGLGLSIAQTIVHGHGGQIELENRSGGGLRVRISLPLAHAGAGADELETTAT
jgi:signal transduction histidine kinase